MSQMYHYIRTILRMSLFCVFLSPSSSTAQTVNSQEQSERKESILNIQYIPNKPNSSIKSGKMVIFEQLTLEQIRLVIKELQKDDLIEKVTKLKNHDLSPKTVFAIKADSDLITKTWLINKLNLIL